MPLSSDELRLRARACRSLASDVADDAVVAALTRAADWFQQQAERPPEPEASAPPVATPLLQDGVWEQIPSAPRAAERVHLTMLAGLRKQGESRFDAQIADLSTVGFRVISHYAMPAGTQVFLTLPGLAAMSARVVWTRDGSLGCRFDTPMHPAVFERVIAGASRA